MSLQHPALWIALWYAIGLALGDWLACSVIIAALPFLVLWLSLWIPNLPRCTLILWPLCVGFFISTAEVARHKALPFHWDSVPTWVEMHGQLEPVQKAGSPSEHFDFYPSETLLWQKGLRLFSPSFCYRLRFSQPSAFPLVRGRYLLQGYLLAPQPPLNPHQMDFEALQRRKGIMGTLEVQTLQLLETAPKSWKQLAVQWGQWLHQELSEHLTRSLPSSFEPEAKLILAMVLGSFPENQYELQQAFSHSGTLHLFSVSGLHVAILAWISSKLIKLIPWGTFYHPLITIALCFTYALTTGWSAASVRAALMIAVILVARMLGQRSSLLNNLGIAAFVLLLLDPQQLFQPGFQLSFAVMLGLGMSDAYIKPTAERWAAPDPFIPKSFLTPAQRFFWKQRRQSLQLFSSSIAALAASSPITLYYFNLLTPISVFANFILIPLSCGILWVSTFSVLAGATGLHTLNSWFNHTNLVLSRLSIKSAQFFAHIPGGYFYPKWSKSAPSIQILALPNGEVALLIRSTNEVMILDTGSTKSYPYHLRPFLRGEGVMQFSYLESSHGDAKHQGALSLIKEEFTDRSAGKIQKKLDGKWRVETFQSLDHRVSITGIFPNWPTRQQDDACGIFKIQWDEWSVLYTADAGFLTEKALLESPPPIPLTSQVLIRAPHRSDLSLSPEWLRFVQPACVITTDAKQPPQESVSLHIFEVCARLGIPLVNLQQFGSVKLSGEFELLQIEGSIDQHSLQIRKN